MGIHFFDTSALQHRYVSGPHTRRVRRIISDQRCECYIADWTVLEIASGLAKRCRAGNLTIQSYDAMDTRFFEDLAGGRLKVRESTPQEIRRARDLLRFAGVIKRRRLTSGDALIAVSCLDLALERKCRVNFYMSDNPLYNILQDIGAFTSALSLCHLP